jgi:hypothetical protein
VPGEGGFLEQDPDGFGQVSCRTAASAIAQRGTAARPRHQLLTWRGVSPDAPEGCLADAGAGVQGGERGMQERSHGALGMELTSIVRSEMPCGEVA